MEGLTISSIGNCWWARMSSLGRTAGRASMKRQSWQRVRVPGRRNVQHAECFSRPICQLAMALNDEAKDAGRQRLLCFVTRLACADTDEIEQQRQTYISSRITHSCR